jgi:GR25 family glycosyltransferase involved in LPS biosynthesis
MLFIIKYKLKAMVSTIFVINLDKRPDRYDAVVKQILASDLRSTPVQRISAFDGNITDFSHLLSAKGKEELRMLQKKGYRDHHAQLSPGAIGCYLSHFETWKRIAALDVPPTAVFLILEDDASVPKHGLREIQKGLHTLANSDYSTASPYILLWELICLQGCIVPKNNLFQPDIFWSLQAYSITADTAKKLIEMPFFPIENQLDTELLFPRDARMLNIFAYPIFENLSGDTDIQLHAREHAPLRRPERGMEAIKYPPLLGNIGQSARAASNDLGAVDSLLMSSSRPQPYPRLGKYDDDHHVVGNKNNTSKPMVIGLISVSAVVMVLFVVLIVMLSVRKK